MAGDGEGEGDGSVGAHGPGDDQAGGLVVELGEPVALVAPLLGAEGVGEPFAGGHADDQAAVEAVRPGAKVPRGAEAGAEAELSWRSTLRYASDSSQSQMAQVPWVEKAV